MEGEPGCLAALHEAKDICSICRRKRTDHEMPWKTILVLIAVAVLGVVAYDIARYEHIVPGEAESPKRQ